ncbi:MAG: ergothioneine biosynthesis protein EgtB [Pseudomonadota bacterium]|nr:ergothioneine biosynthesis protein EgtB [Pseudomonadota bacterium]
MNSRTAHGVQQSDLSRVPDLANRTAPDTRVDSELTPDCASLLLRFREVRGDTWRLAAPLSAEDCALQSMPDASPVKWHLAHTTWFFETFVLEREVGHAAFDPDFRVLFNSYYNAVGAKHPRPKRGLLSRPSLARVQEYRKAVEGRMEALLRSGSVDPEALRLIELGIEHEQQHQELILTDLKHLLSCNPLEPVYERIWPLTTIATRRTGWKASPGGLVEIGHCDSGFAFDNELPRHTVFVAPFEIASHPVTNGEWMRFMGDRGYQRPELWLSMGWDAVQAHGWAAPLYWRDEGDRFTTFTLHGRVEVDPHSPVTHISFFEAEAYARWADARLPTEAEWESVAQDIPVAGNFQESRAYHPVAAAESSEARPAQMFGDVWEWTRSAYEPYPGFRTAGGAVGEYNGKFMCNQYVLRGGSCATPQSHVRASYRNFFPPDARWQFSGVRLARDAMRA